VAMFERLLYRQFGRLRDIAEGPDGNLYLLTSNRDGRGSPKDDDDRVIRLSFK
jgi:glucose/arabinose dehydrogenase